MEDKLLKALNNREHDGVWGIDEGRLTRHKTQKVKTDNHYEIELLLWFDEDSNLIEVKTRLNK